MGKSSKANRTKGNTRPSSSGHSAQLLSGHSLTGFIGFGALEKETPSYVPVTGQQISDATDSSVDSDFRMVMRKMLKRDAITRLKAMQEFGDYCAEKDTDIVIKVIPFWPRLFNRLALDTDRRIREATHTANGKLLAKVKRHIAPFLKNIMGVWLIGQCDLYAPAASSAQVAFSTTFQPPKQSEVLMFCKTEIFAYLKDNLFEQTVKSMSEPNPLSQEDMENKYNLVISATLQGLKLFLSSILPAELENIHEEFHSIVSNNKFWKFAKHKEPQIRSSWFSLVSSICNVRASYFNGTEQKLATTVFSCLSESNPAVSPSVWDSALSIVLNFENCWEGIDIHKVALPHLWSLLAEGGKGNARVLFPCLLPFLSKLPKHVGESEEFLLKIFSSFKHSLKLKTVVASTSECDAILVTFFECLQYICCTRLGGTNAGPDLLKNVLVNEIVPLVECSIYDPKCNHLALSEFYPLLSSLIRKMENQHLSSTGEMSKCYSEVITAFWDAMLPVANKYFSVTESEKEQSLAYLSYFFNCMLQTATPVKTKRKKSVRFEEDSAADDPAEEAVPEKVPDSGLSLSDKSTLSFKVIKDFCVELCKKTSSSCSLKYLRLFEEMLSSVTSRDLVSELVTTFAEDHSYEPDSAFGFFQNVMLKWVEEANDDEDLLCCIFRSVFVICSHIPVEETWMILNCCCKTNVMLLEKVLQNGLTLYKDAPFFKSWLETSLWSSEVVNGLQELVSGKKFFCDSSAKLPIRIHYRILILCLSDVYSKPLLDDEGFETIVQSMHILCDQLVGMEMSYNIELALDFIRGVTIAILQNRQICWKFNATSSLVYRIFQINLNDVINFKDAGDASRVLYAILNAFVDSYIGSIEEVMNDNSLIFKMSEELNSSIQSIETPKQSSHILEQCSFLISSVQKAVSEHKPELHSTKLFIHYKLMDKLLPSKEFWNSLKQGLEINTFHWFLNKKVFYPMLMQNKFSYPEEQVLKYSLVANVVSHILCNTLEEACEELCTDFAHKHLLDLLWFLTFCQGNGITESSEDLMPAKLKENCIKILSCVPKDEINKLKMHIFDLSLSEVSWSMCLQYFCELCGCSSSPSTCQELFEKTSSLEINVLTKSVVRQVLIPYLSSEKKMSDLLEILKEMSTLEESNEDFLGKMGELCCYLRNSDIQPSFEMLHLLIEVFLNIIKYNFEIKTGINSHHMLMISVMSAFVEKRVDIVCMNSIDFYQNLLLFLAKESMSRSFETPEDFLLLNQVSVLFSSLSLLLKQEQLEESVSSSGCVPILLSNKEVHENMIFLFQHVSGIFSNSKSITEVSKIVLRNLEEAMDYIPGEHLINVLVSQHADSEDVVKGDKEDSVLHTLISTLTSSVRSLQIASHNMLLKIMPFLPNLVNEEANSQSEDDVEEEINIPTKLAPLIDLLSFLNEIVDTMLIGIKIGDLCTVIPHTDSYVCAMAYLFAWMELFEFFSASSAQVRLGYALHLEEKFKLLSSLFSNLMRLMPENPMLCLKKGLNVETPKKEDLKLLFITPPVLKPDPSSAEIQSIACYVYASALRKVPAVIRTWFNNLDRKSSDIVNDFTTKYISGLLCMEEIQTVLENEKLFENLNVQARPVAREVSATYFIDDCKIEMCVQLPVNYPLRPMWSERRGKVVFGQHEWRHWLMQMTTVLAYRNGTILDSLNIWKKNLDKKFEGVEECMICYYILHSSTLKLPKLSCHVCRKKFHSACLYKWFHTSNNFTCPLCRNEFAM